MRDGEPKSMAVSSIQSIGQAPPRLLPCSLSNVKWERGGYTLSCKRLLRKQPSPSRSSEVVFTMHKYLKQQILLPASKMLDVKCAFKNSELSWGKKRVPASDQKVYFTHSYRRRKKRKKNKPQIVPQTSGCEEG